MEVLQKKSFNRRKFVSVSLFLTLIILVITGMLIQVFESFEEGFSIHFFTAVHVLTGLIFAVFAVLHTIINWKSLKSYIKSRSVYISKEAIWSLLVIMIVIVVGFLFVYSHF